MTLKEQSDLEQLEARDMAQLDAVIDRLVKEEKRFYRLLVCLWAGAIAIFVELLVTIIVRVLK